MRYVVLFHDLPPTGPRGPHFDWMFESERGLRTWATERMPLPNGPAVPAIALPLHRAEYLDFEGEVSGGRGKVQRVQQGHFELLDDRGDGLTLKLQPMTIDLKPGQAMAGGDQWLELECVDEAAWALRWMTEPPA